MSQSIIKSRNSKPAPAFDQVLLVDDLASAAKWLQKRARGFSLVRDLLTWAPRATLVAAIFLASLVVMFGYAAFYFGMI
jgi:hypothetical protein